MLSDVLCDYDCVRHSMHCLMWVWPAVYSVACSTTVPCSRCPRQQASCPVSRPIEDRGEYNRMGQRRIFQNHIFTTPSIPSCSKRLGQCKNTCGVPHTHAQSDESVRGRLWILPNTVQARPCCADRFQAARARHTCSRTRPTCPPGTICAICVAPDRLGAHQSACERGMEAVKAGTGCGRNVCGAGVRGSERAPVALSTRS